MIGAQQSIAWGIFLQTLRRPCMNQYCNAFVRISALKKMYCTSTDTTEEGIVGAVKSTHIPVMTKEVIERLNPVNGNIYVDMTFGAGGHTKEILKKAPRAKIFALDRDLVAYEMAKEMSEEGPYDITPLHGKFTDLPALFRDLGVKENSIDGFIFDVGASSMQFDTANRGFSLSHNGPLDMRMNAQDPVTAADAVNYLEFKDLKKIISRYGEEKLAEKIATSIIEARQIMGKIETTKQLADIIDTVFPKHNLDKLDRHAHVATKTFQALRIFVNDELNELYNGLEVAQYYLKPMGHCAVITFHSLEDRLVKLHFKGIAVDEERHKSTRDWAKNNPLEFDAEEIKHLTQKRWKNIDGPISPSEMEVSFNPRSRSAKLRAASKP
ncbi:probable methyltransferase-like protein 15 homolog [Lingula anatina]|uniref:Probable methyltransferase-like protein 15 homolog n=1 Tax=Lingula anatina TaxID=7574 RepID=A0A1S3HH09_LINAN|nr:probable methyltransferase-like protein 15 homolog [Lingula anatina]|eukprot:XP_013385312.1 probable methyltransferase-like protein 15 homolog [Lingula anatina]